MIKEEETKIKNLASLLSRSKHLSKDKNSKPCKCVEQKVACRLPVIEPLQLHLMILVKDCFQIYFSSVFNISESVRHVDGHSASHV